MRSNLVAGDANQQTDVFARKLPNGPTELISAGSGAAADGGSVAPAVSANGSVVAFESVAHNLVPGVSPTARNVYVRDRSAGTTTLVSALANGGPEHARQRPIGDQRRRPHRRLRLAPARSRRPGQRDPRRLGDPAQARRGLREGPRQRRDDPDLGGPRRRPGRPRERLADGRRQRPVRRVRLELAATSSAMTPTSSPTSSCASCRRSRRSPRTPSTSGRGRSARPGRRSRRS